MEHIVKEKLKASIIHLSVSALVIGIFFLLILNIWYPSPFFQVSNLQGILLILITVDLVLGPLLTFVVFKPGKPSLKFDLSVIAAIQIAALSYGVVTVYNGHPVYVVYNVDRFTLVAANEVDPQDAKYKEFKVSTFDKPKLVYAKPPEDREERNQLLFDAINTGIDLEHHPEYYEPIDQFTQKITQQGISSDRLLAFPSSKTEMIKFLEKQDGKKASDFAFVPLMGKEKVMLWALNKETGHPIGTLDIDPWELGS